MGKIRVDSVFLQRNAIRMQNVVRQLDDVSESIRVTRAGLQWNISNSAAIRNKLSEYSSYVKILEHKMAILSRTLEESALSYQNVENKNQSIEGSKSIIDSLFIGRLIIDERWMRPFCPVRPDYKPFYFKYFEINKDKKDILSYIKTILEGCDKWVGEDGAGVLKDIISYFESAIGFFSGDKKGLAGFSDWLDLADNSVGVWSGVYDYCQNMYKGMKNGMFGELAQKRVKALGLTAGFLGFASSAFSASTGFDEKKWQSIVADYVDCGKDMITVINSGYALKHIGDVKSLSEIKAGPWSALNIYSAIGEAGVQMVSQGFRSHEKYYADGQWDMEDTGATGINIFTAGVYGLGHSLSLGFDDIIFSAIDNATGGNGTSDMSYAEKAAEGYIILAKKIGKNIGDWLNNLSR